MKYGSLAADRDSQIISGATGKYPEHRSSDGSYKTGGRKKWMTIPNNPECLSRTLGEECGNTDKGKLGGFGGVRQKQ